MRSFTTTFATATAFAVVLTACAPDGPSAEVPDGTLAPAETTVDQPVATLDETATDETTIDETTIDETATDETATGQTPTGTEVTSADGELTGAEVAGLLWMREEEQLAHDVYVALGEVWGLRVFENIAASEQQHIDATIGLLDLYGVDDPAAGNEPGTFTDPRIQELYDELVAQGLESEVAALTVGATIEELDIADLRARADATDEAAIDRVYASLERASRNHLRAFAGQLEMLGADYESTILPDADEIIAAPMERGRDDH